MALIIPVAGIDPAFRNFGIALMGLNIDTMALTVTDLTLIQTEKDGSKKVRVNSDDLRRAIDIRKQYHAANDGCRMVFAEIPSGGQSARAVMSFGVSIGLLASCPKPIIEIQPTETKLATVGTKTASKQEMIEWAIEAYPDAPWKTARNKKGGKPTLDNEHLADAVAVVHAGIKTTQFQSVLSLWKEAVDDFRASKSAA